MEEQSEKVQLINSINVLRNELIKLGTVKGINNKETIKTSQELDKLLYIYQLRFTSK